MNWRFKAVLQQVFSHVPLGEAANYFFQRHVTHTYPRSTAEYATVVGIARAHVGNYTRHRPGPLGEAVFFEFGAGWDQLNPLALFSLGVNRQIVIDQRRLLKPDLVNHAIGYLRGVAAAHGVPRPPQHAVGADEAGVVSALRQFYGIDYQAPRDARATGLAVGSVDCITSTNTLEHVPPDQIPPILRECRRLLGSGGIASFRIDYQDHYAYFDPDTSVYNFLRYSSRHWALYNAGLQWQNRLRHRDYLEMIAAAGFEVLDDRRTEGSPDDLRLLRRLGVPKRYPSHSVEELAVRDALLVVRVRA